MKVVVKQVRQFLTQLTMVDARDNEGQVQD